MNNLKRIQIEGMEKSKGDQFLLLMLLTTSGDDTLNNHQNTFLESLIKIPIMRIKIILNGSCVYNYCSVCNYPSIHVIYNK